VVQCGENFKAQINFFSQKKIVIPPIFFHLYPAQIQETISNDPDLRLSKSTKKNTVRYRPVYVVFSCSFQKYLFDLKKDHIWHEKIFRF
jgi:hypothetical protein